MDETSANQVETKKSHVRFVRFEAIAIFKSESQLRLFAMRFLISNRTCDLMRCDFEKQNRTCDYLRCDFAIYGD